MWEAELGWETAIQAGATVYGAISKNNAARTEAKAITEEARLQAENKAHETVREAGKLQSSFLSSGLTIEGTPTEVLKRAYQYGTEDINQIAKNANTRSKNIMTKARKEMLESFTGMMGGIGSGGSALTELGDPQGMMGGTAFGAGLYSKGMGKSFESGWNTFYDLKDTISNPANSGVF